MIDATGGEADPLWKLMGHLFRAHPWHGVSIGDHAPACVTAFIEIVPTDTVKYEIDKVSGYLRVDRPQQYSNVCPALYGLIPQTYCAEQVAAYSAAHAGRPQMAGDGDPLDICVICERPITHGDLLVSAIPIGGLRIIDGDEADDKIIAVLEDDAVYGSVRDVSEAPPGLVERLRHYFLTYKEVPGAGHPVIEIIGTYGRDEAHEVIRRSQQDYHHHYGGLEALLTAALRG